jgi:hypothetical protein
MIYLLTAIDVSKQLHIYTQTMHRTTQITIEQHKYTTNVEECGPCPVFARFTLTFALQLRNKHKKTSVRLRNTSVGVQYTYDLMNEKIICRNSEHAETSASFTFHLI